MDPDDAAKIGDRAPKPPVVGGARKEKILAGMQGDRIIGMAGIGEDAMELDGEMLKTIDQHGPGQMV